jgi:hypothetical protein
MDPQVAFTYGSVGWGRHTLQDIETVVDEVCYAKTIDNGSLVARFSTEMNVPRSESSPRVEVHCIEPEKNSRLHVSLRLRYNEDVLRGEKFDHGGDAFDSLRHGWQ